MTELLKLFGSDSPSQRRSRWWHAARHWACL